MGLLELGQRSIAAVRRQARLNRPVEEPVLVLTDAILSEAQRRFRNLEPNLRTLRHSESMFDRQLRELRKMKYSRKEAIRFAALLRDSTELEPKFEGDAEGGK